MAVLEPPPSPKITLTEYHSPRWALVTQDGREVYYDGDDVENPPDPARLVFFWPAAQALKADRGAFKELAYFDLTDEECRLAGPGWEPIALAVEIWTWAWLKRHMLPADAQAEVYRAMAAEETDMGEVRQLKALAAEYEAQARIDKAQAAQAREVPTATPYTLTDAGALMATEFNPLVFITSGLIELAAGAYILGGKPKHGKSWLALGLSTAVCTGEDYLDTRPAEPGQAIYIACDDSSERRFQARLRAVGPACSLTGLMGVVTQWSPEADSTIAVLDDVAGKYPKLRIVVIDTLSAFRRGLRTENPYQQEYDELKALNDWAHRHGVVVIVVHHLRKGAVDPLDPFEAISGTLGLQGAVDGMMVLARVDDRDDFGPNDRKLAGFWLRARDIEEVGVGMELKDGRWRVIGTIGDVFQAGTQRLILQVLREADGRWLNAKEIHAAAVFDCKPVSVQKAASRMVAKGLIESHRGALEGKSGGGGGFRIAPTSEHGT